MCLVGSAQQTLQIKSANSPEFYCRTTIMWNPRVSDPLAYSLPSTPRTLGSAFKPPHLAARHLDPVWLGALPLLQAWEMP